MKTKKVILFALIITLLFSSLTIVSEASTFIDKPQKLESYILDRLYDRDEVIEFYYKGGSYKLDELLNNALNQDPYINYSINSWNWSYEGSEHNIKILINIDHLVSKAEEDAADDKINEILNKIIETKMSNHEKIKVIHDYIVLNTKYDTNYNYYSHYDALFRNKAVCNGYALLAYKMYKKIGFNVGFVKGFSEGQNHIWNTLDVNGYTYHIDLTWDDPVPDLNYPIYDYYMLNDAEISKDHDFKGSYSSDAPYYKILNIAISSEFNNHNNLLSLISSLSLNDKYEPIKINLDGSYINFDQPPMIQNGRTLVPVRAIFENLEMNVSWNPYTYEVKGYNNSNNITMIIDEKKAYINGMEYILDSPPKILNGRTLVPVRFIGEAIGKNVSWSSKDRTVIIK